MPACACAALLLGPKPASRSSDKRHLLGASPLCFHQSRGNPVRREEQGDLCRGGDGTEGCTGLLSHRPFVTPLPHASKPDGGRGPLIAGCGSPAGFKGWRGRSADQRGLLDPREPRESSPALASVAPVASTGSFHGAVCCSPGPGFSPGECLCTHEGTEAADVLSGRGGGDSTSGGPRW